jgi:hypothetical protein
MLRNFTSRATTLARLATPVLLASFLGACSGMADWADPTGWFGNDSTASTDQSSTTDASQTADSGKTPDLASIPAKPAVPSTPDEQKQVADSLAADRAQAQYSAETLEGGTEPASAAPAPEPAPDTTAGTATPASAPADQTASSAPSSDTSTAAVMTTDSTAQTPTATADTSGTQVASTEPSAPPPAAPPIAATNETAQPAPAMQASFAPSHAPALDPSVAQYVPQRILSRYQQTAAAASVPGVQGMSSAAPTKPAHRKPKLAPATAPADTVAAPAQ